MQSKIVGDAYDIAFDIGTNSVGWAVTDTTSNILKFRGKNMWGVRLFEEGKSASARRVFRATRRRYLRRRTRILYLQQLIGDIVCREDALFFVRLSETSLWAKDRTYLTIDEKKHFSKGTYLFAEKDFTDIDYYKKYKTIYHLRKALIHSEEKMDIRLVYLAIHHIIKYRGNFLWENQEFSTTTNIVEILKTLMEQVAEYILDDKNFDNLDYDKIQSILLNKKFDKKEKQEKFTELVAHGFPKEEREIIKELSKAIVGSKANFTMMFSRINIMEENGAEIQIDFNDDNYETKEEIFKTGLGEAFYIIDGMKKLYSAILLADVLRGEECISDAMCSLYEKHKLDLTKLKSLIQRYASKSYAEIFRCENKENTYAHYVKNGKCDKVDGLYKYLGTIFKSFEDKAIIDSDANYKYCTSEIAKGRFLDKINSKNNSAIPHQLNKKELEGIIDKQGKYYPELLANKDKIISLLTFRIPYYVGPLNKHSKYSWVERKSGIQIYPWNFEEVVDLESSAEKFIERMRNNCTYLPDKEVLPKNSLIYSKFELLNELNKIRVNGELLCVERKNKIINELFLTFKNVKSKTLINHFNKIGDRVENITGYQKDNEFASSLSAHIDFIKILKDKNEEFGDMKPQRKIEILEQNKYMIENIIKWITLFEDREILQKKIIKTYPEVTQTQLFAIMKLKYTGWGRLSSCLLEEIVVVTPKNEQVNIMRMLEKTNNNFMQLINGEKFGFDNEIAARQVNEKENIFDAIDDLAGSPALKKGVRQTIKLVEEIISIRGGNPKNIFIEFARSDEMSKRTNSREKTLQKLYTKLQVELSEYNKGIEKELKDNSKKLNEEKYYLYFIQHGKCMYTGEALDINNLTQYEVDHIIPRSYICDNSLENKVLVSKRANQFKTDKMVIEESCRRNMGCFWKKLHSCGLIGNKKYFNLIKSAFDETDITRFINRQLVETRQITKHVANLLMDYYKGTNVVAIKAGLVHDYRKQNRLPKLREINDFHHAHDAFLTAIIGKFIIKRYPELVAEFTRDDYIKYQSTEKIKDKYGFIVSAMRYDFKSDGIDWHAEKELAKVIKVFNYKLCNITKKTDISLSKGYFSVNPVKSKENGSSAKAPIPRKKGLDTDYYGGYIGIESAYFIAVDYLKGKKNVRKLIGVPTYVYEQIKNKIITEEDYLKKNCNLIEPKVLKTNILKNQLLEIDGYRCTLASAGEITNATQLILSLEEMRNFPDLAQNSSENDTINKKLHDFMQLWLDKYYCFYGLYDTQVDQVRTFFEKGYFDALELEQKHEFIEKILKLTQASPVNASLKEFSYRECKFPTRFGRKEITIDLDKTFFIDQSVTGLFSRRYRL